MLAASPRSPGAPRRDPLGLILLGAGDRWDVISIFMGVAVALHVALLVFAIVGGMLKDIHDAVTDGRARIHDFLFRQYEVEVIKPKEAPPPEPPPEPEPPPPAPAPVAKAAKPVDDDPYKDVATPPAQATKVLTAAPKEDEPLDLTDKGFVSGEGNAVGGQQSGDGKGDKVTMARKASLTGVEGHHGTAPAPMAPPPPTEDKSRSVQLSGGSTRNCPFPPEADADQVDQAVATIQVTVRPDGSVLSANIVSDPGHGFGRAARFCMLGRHFQPALDRSGSPIVGSTPVNVSFTR